MILDVSFKYPFLFIIPSKMCNNKMKSTLIKLKLGILWCLADGLRGKLGKVAYLEKWVTTITPLTAGETMFTITFEWDESMGFPGAIIIKNHHHSQLYLKTVTLEDIPGHGRVHFICNSWVYPTHRYKYDRVFFSNKVIGFWITNYSEYERMCAPTLCFIGPYSLCLPSRRREYVLLSSWTVD